MIPPFGEKILHFIPHADLLCRGARAAEDIFEKAYRLDIRKALDPLAPSDFDTVVARLSRAMTRAANPTESAALGGGDQVGVSPTSPALHHVDRGAWSVLLPRLPRPPSQPDPHPRSHTPAPGASEHYGSRRRPRCNITMLMLCFLDGCRRGGFLIVLSQNDS